MPIVAKLRLEGESLAVVPIPARLAFCGLPAALSVTLSVAARAPGAVGLNLISMLQLAPAARELPQLWVCTKSARSAPVIAMPEIVKLAVPVFLRVIVT